MTIFEWLFDVMGLPEDLQSLFIWYILAGIVLLVLLDGIVSFLLGGITSLTTRGRR